MRTIDNKNFHSNSISNFLSLGSFALLVQRSPPEADGVGSGVEGDLHCFIHKKPLPNFRSGMVFVKIFYR
ncbi:hypothetical protein COS31_02530 [Candidatus Roizmanbacteria bacterium CG02_land_8_20_14_3_00_36_15]|uniref:Uncharacterized protein n=2 Tax=Candidatus Roizmaniibacteriota TaxID=1752723 RepID=A0A2M8KLP9_9BACT|nr:MAG: hypothetical protein COS51_02825 [Candidatus Roizmanbacteria bacterium CG03_land_8_20_14_0_80_36_21]PIV37943.1 MAG: hypothetical protein COS31_02530 [Candidatus Roizmanbacteria bacterium CG02_land_8_20_14_3_00_36_15]PIY69913.1 MAG: hypothetical protein COY89_04240 [Candidatus Roizmanbacteria bacterium CG_4_10_14_0_8_um_filter_36_36]PJA53919.1 MAG: hypothetical protein CO166_00285 [Candidatus Roizmanbacteria bacterium CG_4_9_14_3_um_filter_36_11]PJC82119.1 MAG: hypothetical protein CO007